MINYTLSKMYTSTISNIHIDCAVLNISLDLFKEPGRSLHLWLLRKNCKIGPLITAPSDFGLFSIFLCLLFCTKNAMFKLQMCVFFYVRYIDTMRLFCVCSSLFSQREMKCNKPIFKKGTKRKDKSMRCILDFQVQH